MNLFAAFFFFFIYFGFMFVIVMNQSAHERLVMVKVLMVGYVLHLRKAIEVV